MPHSKYSSIQFNSKKLYLDIMTVLHGYMHTYDKKTKKKNDDLHTNMFRHYMEGIGPLWT